MASFTPIMNSRRHAVGPNATRLHDDMPTEKGISSGTKIGLTETTKSEPTTKQSQSHDVITQGL